MFFQAPTTEKTSEKGHTLYGIVDFNRYSSGCIAMHEKRIYLFDKLPSEDEFRIFCDTIAKINMECIYDNILDETKDSILNSYHDSFIKYNVFTFIAVKESIESKKTILKTTIPIIDTTYYFTSNKYYLDTLYYNYILVEIND